MSLVCVVGATGVQGGSVVQKLLKNPKWKVRALTRNVNSDKAKALASQGAEVVAADANDEASLVKAFEGATAIFSITAFWESLPQLGRHGAGEEEVEHLKNLARAAAKTPTLQHYILSTLPPSKKISNGKFEVPHFDYKDIGWEWVVENLPDLVAKTTKIWMGWYANNIVNLPLAKITPVPPSGSYVFLQPSKPEGILPVAGDVAINTGILTEALLEAGAKTYGKIAILMTEYKSFTDVVALWEKATGTRTSYVEVSDAVYTKMWGDFGAELASQLRWSEEFPDWHKFDGDLISVEDLGVKEKLIGFEQAITNFKESGLLGDL